MDRERYREIDELVAELENTRLPCDLGDRARVLGISEKEVLQYWRIKSGEETPQ